jgi:predicted NUDIX family NTP pyrophosphohydrolase
VLSLPGLGRGTFPEVDGAEWFDLPSAHVKILDGQQRLLDRLAELVAQPRLRPVS